jgi:hypothetical protein
VTLGEVEAVMEQKKSRDLKAEIQEERLKKKSDPMWFYDEPEELWRDFRKETTKVEREYSEIRVALRDAEAGLRAKPEDDYLKAQVKYLRKRLEDLERLAHWLSADHPTEVLLWGIPHG